MIKTYTSIILVLLVSSFAIAQPTSNTTKKKNTSTITIKNGTTTFDSEEFSESISAIVNDALNSLSFSSNFDNGNFHFDMDMEGLGEMGASIEKSVEKMLKDIEINMEDLSPEEFESSNFNGMKGRKILKDIEQEYGSAVEIIEKINVKLKENGLVVKAKFRLKNGKVVEKSYHEEE